VLRTRALDFISKKINLYRSMSAIGWRTHELVSDEIAPEWTDLLGAIRSDIHIQRTETRRDQRDRGLAPVKNIRSRPTSWAPGSR